MTKYLLSVLLISVLASSALAQQEELLQAYVDENIIIRNINLILSFTQRSALGSHVKNLPNCAQSISAVNSGISDALNIFQLGPQNFSQGLIVLGTAMNAFTNITLNCGIVANETVDAIRYFTQNLTESPGKFIFSRLLNVAFRQKEIRNLWNSFMNSFNVNNSFEVGQVLADVVNTVFTMQPRLDAALNKFFSNKTSGSSAGGIIQCLGNLDKSYLTLNRTWSDYQKTSELDVLLGDGLVVALELPTTLKICVQALRNEKKPKPETEVALMAFMEEVELLSAAELEVVDDFFGNMLPRLILPHHDVSGVNKVEKPTPQPQVQPQLPPLKVVAEKIRRFRLPPVV